MTLPLVLALGARSEPSRAGGRGARGATRAAAASSGKRSRRLGVCDDVRRRAATRPSARSPRSPRFAPRRRAKCSRIVATELTTRTSVDVVPGSRRASEEDARRARRCGRAKRWSATSSAGSSSSGASSATWGASGPCSTCRPSRSPPKICAQLLRLSSGAVSMILNDLSRWGVVRKVWVQGDRRDHFAAEVQLWRMISRVCPSARRPRSSSSWRRAKKRYAFWNQKASAHDPRDRQRAQLQIERIKALLDLARIGKKLLDGLLTTAKLDAEPLTRFMLRRVAAAFLVAPRPSWPLPAALSAQCTRARTLGEVQHRPFQGPVLAPARATGLGERSPPTRKASTRSPPTPPPSRCARPTASTGSTTILRLGISFPAAFRGTDFDNDGKVGFTYKNFLFYTLGAQMQLGAWGIGCPRRFSELRPLAGRANRTIRRSPRRSGKPSRGARAIVLRRSALGSAGACVASRFPSTRRPDGSATNQSRHEWGRPRSRRADPARLLAVAHRRHVSRSRSEGRSGPASAGDTATERPVRRSGQHVASVGARGRSGAFRWARVRSIRVGSTRTTKRRASESRS